MENPQEKKSADLATSDRFSFFSSQKMETITSPTWEGLFPNGDLDHIFQTKQKGRPDPDHPLWWFDVRDATESDVKATVQALSIHRLTAEDVAIREPREKVEVFSHYYLLTFQTLVTSTTAEAERPGNGVPASAGIYILVFQNGVVTFSPSGCNHIQKVRERIRKMHDPSVLTSDWVCYALMYVLFHSIPPSQPAHAPNPSKANSHTSDHIVDSFEPYARAAEAEAEAIEDHVFIARIDDVRELIPQIDVLRRKITHIIRSLTGKVDVLNGFMKRCQVPAPEKSPVYPDGELLLYLGDVQDHLITTLSSLVHIDEIIGRSQANFLAQLSATNLRVSLVINSAMSKVTVLATIFVPCHLITGMFGMNVQVPGQDAAGLGWFFGIVGIFVAFMVICMAAAAKYRLL
ncbi:uncharacterized protein N7459_000878 [Penicillium hispanicum]|uniref:uncharacterized protein n=1 Tax=Penicillium hispanicum TaxID=1080232 RepID=UPI00253FC77C|nr:uncharacterized protein N7459_000878 [Penicillium hispanicum]KAJ5594670.1 hypothetical protein N7459_000878 [Penicillium hispanicum]